MANKFKIGDLEVLVVSDGKAVVPGTMYFRASTPERWNEHKRWLNHDGNLEFEFGCFLVRSGGKLLLIDTGTGPVAVGTFKGGALMGELATAGVKPEAVDVVFVTHVHFDHLGTCMTTADGHARFTFPNATYRWTADEHAHWSSDTAVREVPGIPAEVFSPKKLLDSVGSRFLPVGDGETLAPGISVIATPGHTPGHAGVILSSGGERAFILGDAISCPVQLEEPEWSGMGDMDPKLARESQEAVAKEAEGSGALVGASHFPGLTFGRVLRGEGRRYWQAV